MTDDYHKEIQRVIEKNEDDFEKKFTYLAAGALTLSLSFANNIVASNANWLILLILSWIGLSLSLIINLISLTYSNSLLKKTQNDINSNSLDNNKVTSRNRKIAIANNSSLFLLICGIIFFLLFASINIKKKTNSNYFGGKTRMTDNKKNTGYVEHGRSIPVPSSDQRNTTSTSDNSNNNNSNSSSNNK